MAELEVSVFNKGIDNKNNRFSLLSLLIFQNLDKENKIFKEQLTTLKDEMEDVTEKMNEMTEELRSAQIKAVEYKGTCIRIIYTFYVMNLIFGEMYKFYAITEKILKLEQENAALVIQIEEVTAQQVDRDKMLDEFGIAIEARLSEWKVLNKFRV